MNFIIKKKGSETMSFQENLRYYREKAGYKQAKDFAEALNIPYSTYTGYEVRNREPKYETLCRIADLLQVSTDDLLGRTTNIIGNKEDNKLEKLIRDNIPNFNTSNVGIMLHLNYINKDVICFDVGYSDDCLIGTGEINKEDFIKQLSKIDIALANTKAYKIFYYLADNVINDALEIINKKVKEYQIFDNIDDINIKDKGLHQLEGTAKEIRLQEYQLKLKHFLDKKETLLNLKNQFHINNKDK